MTQHHYRAIDDKGMIITGSFWATNDHTIESYFKKNGLQPLSCTKKKTFLFSLLFSPSVSQGELGKFFFHLHLLLESTIPALEALKVISQQNPPTRNLHMRSIALCSRWKMDCRCPKRWKRKIRYFLQPYVA